MYIKQSKATALITSILIVAVISITAITMQGYLRAELNRTQIILDNDSLLNNIYDIEAWGLARLSKISSIDNRLNAENATLKIVPKNQKNLEGKIVSLNGLFNINYLYDEGFCTGKPAAKNQIVINKIFENLIKHSVGSDNFDLDVKSFIQDVQTWMCSNKKDYTADYNNDQPDWAYQIARQFMVDISEVKLATDIKRKGYINLSKYVAVFPIMTANSKAQIVIDIDAISPSLLSAMANVPLAAASDFIETLQNKSSVERSEALKKYVIDQGGYTSEEQAEVSRLLTPAASNSGAYYMIYSTATFKKNIMQMQTLVYMSKTPDILWRKRGKFYA